MSEATQKISKPSWVLEILGVKTNIHALYIYKVLNLLSLDTSTNLNLKGQHV
jgi:hypothetical protein